MVLKTSITKIKNGKAKKVVSKYKTRTEVLYKNLADILFFV